MLAASAAYVAWCIRDEQPFLLAQAPGGAKPQNVYVCGTRFRIFVQDAAGVTTCYDLTSGRAVGVPMTITSTPDGRATVVRPTFAGTLLCVSFNHGAVPRFFINEMDVERGSTTAWVQRAPSTTPDHFETLACCGFTGAAAVFTSKPWIGLDQTRVGDVQLYTASDKLVLHVHIAYVVDAACLYVPRMLPKERKARRVRHGAVCRGRAQL